MRRMIPWVLGLALLAGCGGLDSIPYEPQQTPERWLTIQPFVSIGVGSEEIVVVQPSSTVLVYLLGVVAIGAGLYIWRIRGSQRSRVWWGVALLLWGLGALFAGTSYQAFSYEIKCAGRAACAWTSWWEVIYLVLSAASVDAMVAAEAYSCAVGRGRRLMLAYALGHAVVYGVVVLTGALVPVKFLISFELLLLVAAPNVLLLFGLNAWRYAQHREAMDLALVGAWLGLGAVLSAYYLYLVLDVTHALWARGIWFSENDVLHLGLMGWMIYLALVVGPRMEDVPGRGVP